MDGRWIKIILFFLLIIMLTGIVSALLDPGLGKPDDARRTRHMAGFSICYPRGWGGTAVGRGVEGESNYIRLAPDRKTGRETAINASFNGSRAQTVANAIQGTFQGQPAFFSSTRAKYDWQWRMQFQRDGKWYQITLITPIEIDVQKSPYWPFIESFRLEKTIAPDAGMVAPVDATAPATAPGR